MTKPLTRAELEHKAVRLELKSLDEAGIFEGYASVFGNEDLGADIVAKGAFANCLRQRGVRGVKMLHEHDCQKPIGRWVDLMEDSHGLLAKGKLNLNLANGREVYEMLKDEMLDGLSIGFRVVKATSARGNESVRTLEEVDLREISTVLFPMNEMAVIGSVKGIHPPDSSEFVREFERWLMQDAGLTRTKARQILGGYKTLRAMPDAGDEVAMPPGVVWSSLEDGLRRLSDAASQ
jgi:hypothetical protein